MNYLDRYHFWCSAGLPDDVCEELKAIRTDEEELKGRFGSDLQFGTAGMRGIMGAGSNRLNRYTVRRAAQGILPRCALLPLQKQVFIPICITDWRLRLCFLTLFVN